LITEKEPWVVPASFDFGLANVKRDASSDDPALGDR